MINKAMQFVFPSPVTMVKSLTRNQMSKLFFSKYHRYGEMSQNCEF